MSSAAGGRKRIALYGGAFDPIHNGHLATIALILNSGAADEVLVIPSGDRPDKPNTIAAQHRMELSRLAIAEAFGSDPAVMVSDLQASGSLGFASIELLDYFKNKQPDAELLLVVGAELLRDLAGWKEAERLKLEAHFLVVRRPSVKSSAPEPELQAELQVEWRTEWQAEWRSTILAAPSEAQVLVSSTTLRELIRSGARCAGLMPKSVYDYCIKHAVYRVPHQ